MADNSPPGCPFLGSFGPSDDSAGRIALKVSLGQRASRDTWLTDDSGHLLVLHGDQVRALFQRDLAEMAAMEYAEREKRYEEAVREAREKKREELAAKNAKARRKTVKGKKEQALEDLAGQEVTKPQKIAFAVEGREYWGEKAGDERRKVESTADFVHLAEEFMLRRQERCEKMLGESFEWLKGVVQKGAGGTGELTRYVGNAAYEMCALIQNPVLLDVWARACAEAASVCLRLKISALDPSYGGFLLWQVCSDERACLVFLQQMKSPSECLDIISSKLEDMPSVFSSDPSIGSNLLLGAASCLSESRAVCQNCATQTHLFFVNLARKGNDGNTIACALAILKNTFPFFCRNLSSSTEELGIFSFAFISDIFASPLLSIHDADTNGDLARSDLGTLFLAVTTLTKGCFDMPEPKAAKTLISSGALRRILSLGEWAYQNLVLAETNSEESVRFAGDIVIPNCVSVLEKFLDELDQTLVHGSSRAKVRVKVCNIILLHSVFLLSLSLHAVSELKTFRATSPKNSQTEVKREPNEEERTDDEEERKSQSAANRNNPSDMNEDDSLLLAETELLEGVCLLLFKSLNVLRDAWLRIQKQKNEEQDALNAKAEFERERRALQNLQSTTAAPQGPPSTGPSGQSEQQENEIVAEQVREHPDEWWLRSCEICCLRGIRALIESKRLREAWLVAHIEPHLTNISQLTDAMTDESRRCNIDIFTLLFYASENWENHFLLNKLSNMLEAVFITDIMVQFPQEPNASFLLSEVLRHSGKPCEEVVVANIISLIQDQITILTNGDEQSCSVLVYLLDTLVQAAKFPKAREMMANMDGGSAMETVLNAMAKLLSLPDKQLFVYDTILHCSKALHIIVQNVRNAEKLTKAQGIQFFCTLIDEFNHSSRTMSGRSPSKRKHYEILISVLKLVRTLAMTRSMVFQKAILTPQVMDSLFSVACDKFDTDPSEWFRDANAKAKRIAASTLAALPFKQDVGEPCLIAVARRFICLDYSELAAIGRKQQAFGSKMLSRIELSENGHELLRRTDVVKYLMKFACDRANPILQANALIGLLYLSSDNSKTQQAICAAALYRLLKLAWTAEDESEQALLAKLIEQLAKNKVNRTRIYKAEIRARATVTRWANEKLGMKRETNEEDQQCHDTESHPKEKERLCPEEAKAAEELESIMKLRKDYSKWLRKDLKVKEKKKIQIPFTKRKAGDPPPSGIPKKNAPRVLQDAVTKRPSLCMAPEESPFWVFRESILSPANNLSAVALSNSKEPGLVDAKFLNSTMYQPVKMLWTKHHKNGEEPLSSPVFGDYNPKSPIPLWKQVPAADPFLALVDRIPRTEYTDDLDVPGEAKVGNITLVNVGQGSSDRELIPALRKVIGEENFRWFFPRTTPIDLEFELSDLPDPSIVDCKFIDSRKCWDNRGEFIDSPINLFISLEPDLNQKHENVSVGSAPPLFSKFSDSAITRIAFHLPDGTDPEKQALLLKEDVCGVILHLFCYLLAKARATGKELDQTAEDFFHNNGFSKLGKGTRGAGLPMLLEEAGRVFVADLNNTRNPLLAWFVEVVIQGVDDLDLLVEKLKNSALLSEPSTSLDDAEQEAIYKVLLDNEFFLHRLLSLWGTLPTTWPSKVIPATTDFLIDDSCVDLASLLCEVHFDEDASGNQSLQSFLVRVARMIPLPMKDVVREIAGDGNDPLTYFSMRLICGANLSLLGLETNLDYFLNGVQSAIPVPPFGQNADKCKHAPVSERLKVLLGHLRRVQDVHLPKPEKDGNKKILEMAGELSTKCPTVSPCRAIRYVVKLLEAKSCVPSSKVKKGELQTFLMEAYDINAEVASILIDIVDSK